MNAIWGLLASFVLSMGLIAAIVFGLGDATVFVSPPEAVVESFVRALSTRNYEPARRSLSKELSTRTTAETLRSFDEKLRSRTGEITDVRGEKGWHTDVSAEASAIVKTSDGAESSISFRLGRENGLWVINSLPEL